MSDVFLRLVFTLSFLQCTACSLGLDAPNVKDVEGENGDSDIIDADQDGFAVEDDCNDNNPAVNPNASDPFGDNIDQNCDGADGIDSDGDGFASYSYGGVDCNDSDPTTIGDDDLDGYYSCIDDCDDTDYNTNPGALDTWYDGVDQNCDGLDDYDQDGDGYASYEYGGVDCNDLDADVTGDVDGDGYHSCIDDCNDSDVSINPSVNEVWYDGIDQDCDGGNDFDQDGDGHGSVDYEGGTDCDDLDASTNGDADLDGYLSCVDDCDDLNWEINPGITDICEDGIDQDCDGMDLPCSPSGTVMEVNGTWINVSYQVCGTSGGCTASDARTACTSLGMQVVSHASNGTSSVHSLGATASCMWSVSYFTVNTPMASNECLVGVSNLDWTSCCGTSSWHGNTMPFGSVGSTFGYIYSSETGYSSTYPNNSGTTWGCVGNTSTNGLLGSCSTYYVACY